MTVDYSVLENDFDCACNDVITNLTAQYSLNYQSGGPGRLEAFLDLIKTEFEKAEISFIEKNMIAENAEALHVIRAITKKHAKLCVEHYGKMVM